jgi:hypothetical protein
MTYPRAAIDPAVLQRLYERERSLRKVAAALQAECGIAVSAPTVAAHLRRLEAETTHGPNEALHQPRNLRQVAQRGPKRYPLIACQNPTCDRQTAKPPYCDRCRLRVKRHGDPAVVVKRGRKG